MNGALPLPRRAALGGGLGLLLAPACSSSPEPDYHRLVAVPGAPARAAARVVELRRVGLPGYLDRSEVVRAGPGTRLEVLRNVRWGEPLGAMATRVLAEDLAQRLPGSAVADDAGAVRLSPDAAVEADLRRFEAGPSGAVELAAQVAVRFGPARPGVARSFRFAVPVEGQQGAPAVAAAMSGALGRLAAAIAAALPPR